MGKPNHGPAEGEVAKRQFYADLPHPLSAAEECEAQDDAAEILRDEAAEKLRRAGCPAREAQTYVEAVMAVLRARDAAFAKQAMSEGQAHPDGMRIASGELLEALSRIGRDIVRAPKPRLSAGCLLLALGDYLVAKSAREWAEKQHVSHELAADAVEAWQQLLNVPRTSGQKSEAARNSYQHNRRAVPTL